MLAAAMLAGCAWGPGTGYATLAPGALTARVSLPAGRQADGGGWKTSSGYVVKLSGPVALSFTEAALQAPGASAPAGTGGTFDPANPPPGYGLCHNGHCHRDDGALIDYADIQAALSAGGAPAAPVTVARFTPAPAAVPAPGEVAVTLGDCTPDCFLEAGSLSRATLGLRKLSLSGTVEAGPGAPALPSGQRAFTLDLPLDGLTLTAPLAVTIDRAGPATYHLTGTVAVSERLFDGLPWARLAESQGPIALAADAETRELLLAGIAQSTWIPQLTSR